jgi:hypothetical protein
MSHDQLHYLDASSGKPDRADDTLNADLRRVQQIGLAGVNGFVEPSAVQDEVYRAVEVMPDHSVEA